MERRSFIKLLASGALGSLFEKLLPGKISFADSLRNSKSDPRTKRIFVSDLHMGEHRTLYPSRGYPYGWLGEKRADMFTRFLDTQVIAKHETVKEVVFLGDIMDGWTLKTDLSPVPIDTIDKPGLFHGIAFQNKINKKIIEKLIELKSYDITLKYVPGNHDMLLTEDILKNIIPNVEYISDKNLKGKPMTGLGTYTSDDSIIAAEHGHRYGIFNAPNPVSSPPHVLPYGYYITRFNADKLNKENKPLKDKQFSRDLLIDMLHKLGLVNDHKLKTYFDIHDKVKNEDEILKLFQQQLSSGGPDVNKCWPEFLPCAKTKTINVDPCKDTIAWIVGITIIYLTLMQKMNFHVKMDYTDKYPSQIDWDYIKRNNVDLCNTWEKIAGIANVNPEIVNPIVAIFSDATSHLSGIAAQQFSLIDKPEKNAPRIIIFGHTHEPVITNRAGLKPVNKDPHRPSKYIYANCGSWIDNVKTCTYVETETDLNLNRCYVRLKDNKGRSYPVAGNKKGELYINL
jgi:UDP-2,3-diacylglucosamine pyrophosphatase LpxH